MHQADIKPRLKSELKFIKSTAHIPADWASYELLAISDRTEEKGVLLLQPNEELFIAQYELSRRIIDHATGRARAIICDFCYTWQPGSNAASITFTHAKTKHKVSFLCCADLECSQHVRTVTKASLVSRSQIRENLSNDDRVARLKRHIEEKIHQLEISPSQPRVER